MRRRGDSLGSIMVRIIKSTIEHNNGRIRYSGNAWVLVGRIPKGCKPLHPDKRAYTWQDDRGRDTMLVKRRSARCTLTAMAEEHPQKGQISYVLYAECQKCEHHRKPVGSIHYHHCAYAKQQRGGIVGAIKETGKMIAKAHQDAETILKGGRL